MAGGPRGAPLQPAWLHVEMGLSLTTVWVKTGTGTYQLICCLCGAILGDCKEAECVWVSLEAIRVAAREQPH